MKDSLVEAGLRALREEMPSDESKRATLARLGLGAAPAPPAVSGVEPGGVEPGGGAAGGGGTGGSSAGTVRWLLAGMLLGALALALRHWFL